MRELILKSPAKLNLYLDVLDKRKDGFYNILTLFERIDLSDVITFRENFSGKVKVESSSPEISEKNNLVYRITKILKKDFSVSKGVDIFIEKRIPLSAGLAGGSSNAAFTLLGLNRFWNLKLKRNELLSYARKIGSDVSFFVSRNSFALGLGRGDKILPLDIKRKFWHVLVLPKIKVSTKTIYERYRPSLREKTSLGRLIFALKDNSLSKKNLLSNALEKTTERYFKVIRESRKILESFKIKAITMSGSGPAIFGIVSARKEGEKICRQLKYRFGDEFSIFLAKTF